MKKKPNAHADVPRNLIFPRCRAGLPARNAGSGARGGKRRANDAGCPAQCAESAPKRRRPRHPARARRVASRRGGYEPRHPLPSAGAGDKRRAADEGNDVRHGGIIRNEGDAGNAAPLCCAADHQDWYMTKCPFRDWKGRKRVSGRKSASHKRNRSRRRRYQARPSAKRWRECCGGAPPRT